MARIRTIKPEFWTDEKITECSVSARLLFIGMWNFADDAGNLERSAKQIKARVFPIDNIDCEPLIRELIEHGLLIEYSVSEKIFLHIPKFTKHQIINRPSKPVCPDYDEALITHGTLTEYSLQEGKGKEGKGSSTSVSHDSIVFDGSRFENLNGYLSNWKEAYPAIDVESEISKAAAWLVANPKNKKKQYARFLNGWLSRAQDRAPRVQVVKNETPEEFTRRMTA